MGLCGWGGAEVRQDGFHSIKRKRKIKRNKNNKHWDTISVYVYNIYKKIYMGLKLNQTKFVDESEFHVLRKGLF